MHGNCILTSYKHEKDKHVSLLSTTHEIIEYEDKKSTTLPDYNKT